MPSKTRTYGGVCSKCGQDKTGYHSWCRPCMNASQQARREALGSAEYNKRQRDYRDANLSRYLHRGARIRAEARGLPFDIEMSDILIPELCPLLGIVLKNNRGRLGDDSPTVDRLVNDKGYVKGNVWVISYKANRIKQDATLPELRRLLTNLEAVYGQQRA